ncbi:hypothetical protein [Methylococcus capsulatus]|uniref:hypothetical protein n=1 Tax=Methylococcus capsulatus TaxID=414 RepID=UPI001C52FC20|nr:hypothetical protein [Methylococcus capsulatus]QXP89466.1 hypothetical protein KW114_10115 [Methylococcus capsulatus]
MDEAMEGAAETRAGDMAPEPSSTTGEAPDTPSTGIVRQEARRAPGRFLEEFQGVAIVHAQEFRTQEAFLLFRWTVDSMARSIFLAVYYARVLDARGIRGTALAFRETGAAVDDTEQAVHLLFRRTEEKILRHLEVMDGLLAERKLTAGDLEVKAQERKARIVHPLMWDLIRVFERVDDLFRRVYLAWLYGLVTDHQKQRAFAEVQREIRGLPGRLRTLSLEMRKRALEKSG